MVLAPWEVHALRSRLFLRDDAAAKKELERAVALAPTPLPPAAAVLKATLEKSDAKKLLVDHPTAAPVLVAAYGQFDVGADRAMVEKALQTSGSDVELLLLATNTAFFADDLDKATEYADRGQRLAPWSVDFAVLRVRLALARKECAQAELRMSQATSLIPERTQGSALEGITRLRAQVAGCQP